jgi:hypothetical protein
MTGYCEPSLISSEGVVDRELTWKEMGKKERREIGKQTNNTRLNHCLFFILLMFPAYKQAK